jgi:hypothetical protein
MDEALSPERRDGLADWTSANPELPGDLRLDEARPRMERAIQDALAQDLACRLRERRTGGERLEGFLAVKCD